MERDSFINALNVGTTFINGKHNPVRFSRYSDGRYVLSGNGFFSAADSIELVKDDPTLILFTKNISIEDKTVGILKFIINCDEWVVE